MLVYLVSNNLKFNIPIMVPLFGMLLIGIKQFVILTQHIDEQTCEIKISAWDYTTDVLIIEPLIILLI